MNIHLDVWRLRKISEFLVIKKNRMSEACGIKKSVGEPCGCPRIMILSDMELPLENLLEVVN